jgi:hypothetical protein
MLRNPGRRSLELMLAGRPGRQDHGMAAGERRRRGGRSMRYADTRSERSTRPGDGRLAQRESASFTPRRSLVRSQYRPPGTRPGGGPRSARPARRTGPSGVLAGTSKISFSQRPSGPAVTRFQLAWRLATGCMPSSARSGGRARTRGQSAWGQRPADDQPSIWSNRKIP